LAYFNTIKTTIDNSVSAYFLGHPTVSQVDDAVSYERRRRSANTPVTLSINQPLRTTWWTAINTTLDIMSYWCRVKTAPVHCHLPTKHYNRP